MLVRIHSVLTPEQRRGLDAIAKRHEAERNRPKITLRPGFHFQWSLRCWEERL